MFCQTFFTLKEFWIQSGICSDRLFTRPCKKSEDINKISFGYPNYGCLWDKIYIFETFWDYFRVTYIEFRDEFEMTLGQF